MGLPYLGGEVRYDAEAVPVGDSVSAYADGSLRFDGDDGVVVSVRHEGLTDAVADAMLRWLAWANASLVRVRAQGVDYDGTFTGGYSLGWHRDGMRTAEITIRGRPAPV